MNHIEIRANYYIDTISSYYITHTYIFRIITMTLQLNINACINYLVLQLLFTKLSRYPICEKIMFNSIHTVEFITYICVYYDNVTEPLFTRR